MKRVDRLKREARLCAWNRNHLLTTFRHDGRGHHDATCPDCGCSVTITERPQPNECDIMGDAVAVNCRKSTGA